jgi:hypothetical protein
MTMKAQIYSALQALADGRVYTGAPPVGVVTPYIIYQRAGGRPVNFADGAIPDRKNSRIQINVWADSMAVADPIALQIENILRQAPALQVSVLTEVLDTYDEETGRRGTMQDFDIWY